MKIGFAGMGRMGAAMAERLVKLGRDVTVWNRDPAKTKAVAAAGAKVAATPRALAEGCEIIMSCVSDGSAIEAVYNGPDGLFSGDIAGRLFVEMSTVRPGTPQALAAKAAAKGAAVVDCPVGGSTVPARDGKLIGFVGGSDADVARVRPVLEQLCRRVEHLGPVGAGCSMKLCINLPLLVYWQVLGEALTLCQPLGLDPKRVIDILSETSGGPNALKSRGPAIAQALSGSLPDNPTFNVVLSRKDLMTMVEEAKSLGYDLPVTSRAIDFYDAAISDGLAEADIAAVPARWLKQRRGR